jgi:phosphoenolpyruvate carboxykinase (GTP)
MDAINQSYDIVSRIGAIESPSQATKLLCKWIDENSFARIRSIQNPQIVIKIANAIAMCQPDKVFVHTGSPNDREYIRQLAVNCGEEQQIRMPGHTVHFDLKQEQGRIVDRTFYIADPEEKLGSLAARIERDEAFSDIESKMSGIMIGHTMLIGFYIRGPIGSPVSNPALEITSSAYVMHSADLLYRNCYSCFDQEVSKLGHFYTNIHCQGQNRPEDLPDARVYMDRRQRTTYSVFCTYAGNTLLMKKGNHRFSVDKAVYENPGYELAEHMFISGLKGPAGRTTWCVGAAPSGCGKTTTAMAGDYFVGDDLAQMWLDDQGAIRAVNPERGIFGIVEDVNREGDPHLMDCLRDHGIEVIWSNVLVDDKGVPHWVGNGETAPAKGFNYQGPWHQGLTDDAGNAVPISHPNARCTLTSKALANYSELAEDPKGVEVRIVTYSGRDSDTMPPVWAADSPAHGVVIGATIVSAATATEIGASGVKRAPWANAPFIPGSLGDYMAAQFQFFTNPQIHPDKKPLIAGLNYFLTEKSRGGTSNRLLGEKKDVKVWLAWLERRVHGDVAAIATPIGQIPYYEDLENLFDTLIAKRYSYDLYQRQFALHIDGIVDRIDLQLNAYKEEENIPDMFFELIRDQRKALLDLKDECGAIVTPDMMISLLKSA